jgi:hypothetical protein
MAAGEGEVMSRRNGTHTARNRRQTGPKTAAGKARSSRNALRHGLRSPLPVLPGEQADDWELHRKAVVASLAPAGALEAELAQRVALLLWRLRRVSAFETGVIAAQVQGALAGPPDTPPDGSPLQKARKQLEEQRRKVAACERGLDLLRRLDDLPPDAPVAGGNAYGALFYVREVLTPYFDAVSARRPGWHLTPNPYVFELPDDCFAELGVPSDFLADPWAWDGWTAAAVRDGIDLLAFEADAHPPDGYTPAASALVHLKDWRRQTRAETARREAEVARLQERAAARQDAKVHQALLPRQPALDIVLRYEAHLHRQLLQSLHTLERLQAARVGQPVPLPAALDVTVSTGAAAAAGSNGQG